MAHFAKLGANGKVIQVLTLDNKDMLNADGVEDESVGQQYLDFGGTKSCSNGTFTITFPSTSSGTPAGTDSLISITS